MSCEDCPYITRLEQGYVEAAATQHKVNELATDIKLVESAYRGYATCFQETLESLASGNTGSLSDQDARLLAERLSAGQRAIEAKRAALGIDTSAMRGAVEEYTEINALIQDFVPEEIERVRSVCPGGPVERRKFIVFGRQVISCNSPLAVDWPGFKEREL